MFNKFISSRLAVKVMTTVVVSGGISLLCFSYRKNIRSLLKLLEHKKEKVEKEKYLSESTKIVFKDGELAALQNPDEIAVLPEAIETKKVHWPSNYLTNELNIAYFSWPEGDHVEIACEILKKIPSKSKVIFYSTSKYKEFIENEGFVFIPYKKSMEHYISHLAMKAIAKAQNDELTVEKLSKIITDPYAWSMINIFTPLMNAELKRLASMNCIGFDILLDRSLSTIPLLHGSVPFYIISDLNKHKEGLSDFWQGGPIDFRGRLRDLYDDNVLEYVMRLSKDKNMINDFSKTLNIQYDHDHRASYDEKYQNMVRLKTYALEHSKDNLHRSVFKEIVVVSFSSYSLIKNLITVLLTKFDYKEIFIGTSGSVDIAVNLQNFLHNTFPEKELSITINPFIDQKNLLERAILFISSCGHGSFKEAIRSLTPILCIPTNPEQQSISNLVVNQFKIGVQIQLLEQLDNILTKISKAIIVLEKKGEFIIEQLKKSHYIMFEHKNTQMLESYKLLSSIERHVFFLQHQSSKKSSNLNLTSSSPFCISTDQYEHRYSDKPFTIMNNFLGDFAPYNKTLYSYKKFMNKFLSANDKKGNVSHSASMIPFILHSVWIDISYNNTVYNPLKFNSTNFLTYNSNIKLLNAENTWIYLLWLRRDNKLEDIKNITKNLGIKISYIEDHLDHETLSIIDYYYSVVSGIVSSLRDNPDRVTHKIKYLVSCIGAILSDFIRSSVLYKYGGVYIDLDYVFVQSPSSIINKVDSFMGMLRWESYGLLSNSFMAFKAHHPILRYQLNKIVKPALFDYASEIMVFMNEYFINDVSNFVLKSEVYKYYIENKSNAYISHILFNCMPMNSVDLISGPMSISVAYFATANKYGNLDLVLNPGVLHNYLRPAPPHNITNLDFMYYNTTLEYDKKIGLIGYDAIGTEWWKVMNVKTAFHVLPDYNVAIFTLPEIGHITYIIQLLSEFKIKNQRHYNFICYTHEPNATDIHNLELTNTKLQEAGCQLHFYSRKIFHSYHEFKIPEFIAYYELEFRSLQISFLLVDRWRLFFDFEGSPIIIAKRLQIKLGIVIADTMYHDDETECFSIKCQYESLFLNVQTKNPGYYCLKDVDFKFQRVLSQINDHKVSEKYIKSWYQSVVEFQDTSAILAKNYLSSLVRANSSKNSTETFFKNGGLSSLQNPAGIAEDLLNHYSFSSLNELEKNTSDDKKLIYISFGSYLTSCITITYLINLLADSYDLIVSVSNHDTVLSCVKNGVYAQYQNKIEDRSIDIRLFVNKEDAYKSDIIISACGSNTMLESLAKMKPIICMPWGEEQKINAKAIEKLGFGAYLYDKHQDPNIYGYDITLDNNTQNKDFEDLLRSALNVTGNGYSNIVNNYIEYFQQNEMLHDMLYELQGESVGDFFDMNC